MSARSRMTGPGGEPARETRAPPHPLGPAPDGPAAAGVHRLQSDDPGLPGRRCSALGTASILQNALRSGVGRVLLLVLVLLLTVGAFWCILTAAAVTRRRTRLVLDRPLQGLWDAVGGAGEPPKDASRRFVGVATLLLVTGWVIAPIAAAALYRFTL